MSGELKQVAGRLAIGVTVAVVLAVIACWGINYGLSVMQNGKLTVVA